MDLRSQLLDDFKRLRRASPVPSNQWRALAPTLVSRLGHGNAIAAVQRLRVFEVDEDRQRVVDAALESLALGIHRGSVDTRLTYFGASLPSPVGYWQARRLADEGLRVLAQAIAEEGYVDEPGFTISVAPSALAGHVSVEVMLSIGKVRQDLYVDVAWVDGNGARGSRSVHVPRGTGYLDNLRIDDLARGEGEPTVSISWPEGLDVVVFAYCEAGIRCEFAKFLSETWVTVLPDVP